jgi:hypothetical protein
LAENKQFSPLNQNTRIFIQEQRIRNDINHKNERNEEHIPRKPRVTNPNAPVLEEIVEEEYYENFD